MSKLLKQNEALDRIADFADALANCIATSRETGLTATETLRHALANFVGAAVDAGFSKSEIRDALVATQQNAFLK